MRPSLLLGICALSSCNEPRLIDLPNATKEVLIAMARNDAAMPECAASRVDYASQLHTAQREDIPELLVVFDTTPQCRDLWFDKLELHSWEDIGSGYMSDNMMVFNMSSSAVGIYWDEAEPIEGVPDRMDADESDAS